MVRVNIVSKDGEWQVQARWPDRSRRPDADYYTTCKADAYTTAMHIHDRLADVWCNGRPVNLSRCIATCRCDGCKADRKAISRIETTLRIVERNK